jgi:hypothetical protein
MNKNSIIVIYLFNVFDEYNSNLIESSSIWNLFRILKFELNLNLISGSVPIYNSEVDILFWIILKTNFESVILNIVSHFLRRRLRAIEFHFQLPLPIHLRKLNERLIIDYSINCFLFFSINYDLKWLFARLRKTII